jgi:hypothetical protein
MAAKNIRMIQSLVCIILVMSKKRGLILMRPLTANFLAGGNQSPFVRRQTSLFLV